MPRTLRAIKLVDMKASKVDDGGIADLKRRRGELQYEATLLKKVHHTKRTEEQKARLATLTKEIAKAQEELKQTEVDHKRKLAQWVVDGQIKFRKKVYIDYKGIVAPRPRHYIKWCRYEKANNYREFRDWQSSMRYSPVISGQDPYWPEGLSPDNKGYYVFGDLILVKISMKDYLIQRWEDIQRANNAPQGAIDKFKSDVERSGGDVPQEIISKIMGQFDKQFKSGAIPTPL